VVYSISFFFALLCVIYRGSFHYIFKYPKYILSVLIIIVVVLVNDRRFDDSTRFGESEHDEHKHSLILNRRIKPVTGIKAAI